MRRRSILLSLLSTPALTGVARSEAAQTPAQIKRGNGVATGPNITAPGISETPTIPVVPATDASIAQASTFNNEQFAALSKLGDILVPAWNGKPGASQARAASFLDFLVGCSPEERHHLYKRGLDRLNEMSESRFGKPFAATAANEYDALLAPLRQASSGPTHDDFQAFLIAAKHDFLRATVNSHPYIDAVSEERRPRNASRFYWLPIE